MRSARILACSGPGSLRQAILEANASAADGHALISFDPGLSGTITLTSGALNITHDMFINGPGASLLTVSGATSFQIFRDDAANFTLNGLTLSGGRTNLDGGAISEITPAA